MLPSPPASREAAPPLRAPPPAAASRSAEGGAEGGADGGGGVGRDVPTRTCVLEVAQDFHLLTLTLTRTLTPNRNPKQVAQDFHFLARLGLAEPQPEVRVRVS